MSNDTFAQEETNFWAMAVFIFLALLCCFLVLLYGIVLLTADRLSWYFVCPPITPKALVKKNDVQINGVHLRVVGNPKGRPLLVCHGNAGNVDMWEDSLNFFNATHHVFVFDYRYISGGTRVHHVDDLLADGREVIRILELLRPDTVWYGLGVSLGGLILPQLQRQGKQALLCPLRNRSCAIKYHTAGLVPISVFGTETEPAVTDVETRVWLAERESLVPHECSAVPKVTPQVVPGTNHVSLLHDSLVRRELIEFLK